MLVVEKFFKDFWDRTFPHLRVIALPAAITTPLTWMAMNELVVQGTQLLVAIIKCITYSFLMFPAKASKLLC